MSAPAAEPRTRREVRGDERPLDTLYICDWLPPDFGAVGQYSLLFARRRAEEGRNVALLGLSSDAAGILEERHGRGALTIIRLKASRYDKGSAPRRLWWTVQTNTRLLSAAWPLMRRAERVLFTGSPPLFLHWIAPSRALHGRRLVYRITDFHPECAIAARGGVPSPLQRLVLRLTRFWRRRVDEFEVLGRDQAERLRASGVSGHRITYKPDPSPVSIPPDTTPLPRPWGSSETKLLLYSGNWGLAHEAETFLEGYRRHHAAGGGVVLWLNAIGSGAAEVAATLRLEGLPLIRGAPTPLDQLAALLATPDAHLITLKDAFVGYALPSKVHGCVASGKPTLFIGSDESDVHRIAWAGLGRRYARASVGDPAAVAAWLDELAQREPATRRQLSAPIAAEQSRAQTVPATELIP